MQQSLGLIREHTSRKLYIPTYLDLPKLSYDDLGFPSLHINPYSAAVNDYSRLVHDLARESPDLNAALKGFVAELLSIPSGAKYFTPTSAREADAEWPVFVLAKMIDRYIHLAGTELIEPAFLECYLPIESAIFSEILIYSIYVPIVCARFEFQEYDLASNVRIVKMSDELQVARFDGFTYQGYSVHMFVAQAATHALVIENCSMPNINMWANEIDWRRQTIDNVFASIRTASRIPLGYAQLVQVPNGWAHSYKWTIRTIAKIFVRSYPPQLEDGGWRRADNTIHKAEIETAHEILTAFMGENQRHLALPLRRINAACLRDNPEDVVLDVAMALESLLTPGEKTEITHKLALRIAAATRLLPESKIKPSEMFAAIKRLYDYRSALVHGNRGRDKPGKDKIKLSDIEINADDFALEVLRILIHVFVRRSEVLREPNLLDVNVLLDRVWPT